MKETKKKSKVLQIILWIMLFAAAVMLIVAIIVREITPPSGCLTEGWLCEDPTHHFTETVTFVFSTLLMMLSLFIIILCAFLLEKQNVTSTSIKFPWISLLVLLILFIQLVFPLGIKNKIYHWPGTSVSFIEFLNNAGIYAHYFYYALTVAFAVWILLLKINQIPRQP